MPPVNLRELSEEELLELVEENKQIFTEYLDLQLVRNLVDHVLDILNDVWFRPVFIGFDERPQRNDPDRPLIFASNHSGMAFPWDAIVFASEYYRRNNYDITEAARPLVAPMLSKTTLMNPFLIRDFWKRAGGIDATSLNFETMMNHPESDIMIYPEGVPGIGKGFNRKYQLQRFATSTLRMSIKYKTDVIPFATINGEYINPYVYSFDPINKLVQKIGIPFLPIGVITPFLLIFPWLFYFGFPAKLTFVMGERIKPYELTDKPFEEMTQDDFIALRDKVHVAMQEQFDIAVEKYGQNPYHWREFFAQIRANIGKFPYYLPWTWPILFTEFERQHNASDGKSIHIKFGLWPFLKYLFRNPISFAYFIPILGWIPLLIRGYRNSRL